MFTDFHIEQLRLSRIAFQIEVLKNGLRKKIVETVKVSAKGNFDKALCFAGIPNPNTGRAKQRRGSNSDCKADFIWQVGRVISLFKTKGGLRLSGYFYGYT